MNRTSVCGTIEVENRSGSVDTTPEHDRNLQGGYDMSDITSKAFPRVAQTATCSRCKQQKPASEFYKNKTRPGGLQSYCKACDKARQRVRSKTEKYKATCRVYNKSERRKQLRIINQAKPEVRAANNRSKDRWKQKNPEANKAHWLSAHAVKKKVLIPKPCIVCGEEPAEKHHEDYSKPLNITWLCKAHHLKRHRELKAPG